jgi:hypothetical protein
MKVSLTFRLVIPQVRPPARPGSVINNSCLSPGQRSLITLEYEYGGAHPLNAGAHSETEQPF